MHAEPFSVKRLISNVLDESVRRARVIFVVVITEREVAEFHIALPDGVVPSPALSGLWQHILF
jgi:hypothetical protein